MGLHAALNTALTIRSVIFLSKLFSRHAAGRATAARSNQIILGRPENR